MNNEFDTDSYFQDMYDEMTDIMHQESHCINCLKISQLIGDTKYKCEDHTKSHKERDSVKSTFNGRSFDDICEEAYRTARVSKENGNSNN